MRTTTRLVAILAGALLALSVPVVALADDASPSPGTGTGPTGSVSPSGSPSASDSPGAGRHPGRPTERDAATDLHVAFDPNPAVDNHRATLRIEVEYTGVGGSVVIDGLGEPLAIQSITSDYFCDDFAGASHVVCEMPAHLDSVAYVVNMWTYLRPGSSTRTVTVTAHTEDGGAVSKTLSVTIVPSASPSPTTPPTASTTPTTSTSATASASASASTGPVSATGDLPVTGNPLTAIAATAATLLAAGAILLAATRRRRRA